MLAKLRAAWWAYRAIRRAKTIPVGSNAIELPDAPQLPSSARRGVNAALRLAGSSCLVRATVLQAWWLSQGESRDLIIGVTAPSKGFAAHAWLEGDPPCHSEGFAELTRQPAHR
jgi:transglutaminase superfamily protein